MRSRHSLLAVLVALGLFGGAAPGCAPDPGGEGAGEGEGEGEGEGDHLPNACSETGCRDEQVCFSYVDLGDLAPCPVNSCQEKPGHDDVCAFNNEDSCLQNEVGCADELSCIEDDLRLQPPERHTSHCLLAGEEAACDPSRGAGDCDEGLDCVNVFGTRGFRCRVGGGAGAPCSEPDLDPALDGCADGLTCQDNVQCG